MRLQFIRCGLFAALVVSGLTAVSPSAIAQSRSVCDDEVARLKKAESELPRVSVAPPGDRQILCISLETNILFAQRLAAHLKQCPKSPFTKVQAAWVRANSAYTAQFSERACRPAIKS